MNLHAFCQMTLLTKNTYSLQENGLGSAISSVMDEEGTLDMYGDAPADKQLTRCVSLLTSMERMEFLILSTLYIDELISCKGHRVGGQVHYKLAKVVSNDFCQPSTSTAIFIYHMVPYYHWSCG